METKTETFQSIAAKVEEQLTRHPSLPNRLTAEARERLAEARVAFSIAVAEDDAAGALLALREWEALRRAEGGWLFGPVADIYKVVRETRLVEFRMYLDAVKASKGETR